MYETHKSTGTNKIQPKVKDSEKNGSSSSTFKKYKNIHTQTSLSDLFAKTT